MEAPLIMMPTRGHTRFRQLLLGSVTASVLHEAVCPVWTEAHREEGPEATGVYRTMVCAIDMGPRTRDVLQAAIEFSSHFDASLHVVHSVPGIDPRFPSGPADRAHALLVAEARENFSDLCQQARVTVPLEIVEDVGLVNGIMGATAKYVADLLIIGRGVIQGTLGRLRTNAHEIIRRSPCAVLSV
jgi:nucleotide-binding universal stress UspA family protein